MPRRFLRSVVLLALAGPASAAPLAPDLASAHAIVVDDASGKVLLAKEAQAATPIASLTKLLTAMVVLDAKQPPQTELRVTEADLDRIKHTRGGVPVGTVATRGALLELALVSSDNRAASALARSFRAGLDGFAKAVQRKIRALGLRTTTVVEPTGLSPHNTASAEDLARLLRAAARYPELARITSQAATTPTIMGRPWEARNTNALVGEPGWEVMLSKTGYTREAGLCLGMQLKVAGRVVNLVLLGAPTATERTLDVQAIANWLGGSDLVARTPRPPMLPAAPAGATAAAAMSAVAAPSAPEPASGAGAAPGAAASAEGDPATTAGRDPAADGPAPVNPEAPAADDDEIRW